LPNSLRPKVEISSLNTTSLAAAILPFYRNYKEDEQEVKKYTWAFNKKIKIQTLRSLEMVSYKALIIIRSLCIAAKKVSI
jgi:hypothetical protein